MPEEQPKHGWMTPEHVALLLLGTPAEHRGNFLLAVSECLYKRGQKFTGKLFQDAGETYNKSKVSERK